MNFNRPQTFTAIYILLSQVILCLLFSISG
uniref:Uncharacterized protein n=1 Tax=Arundo donax TaxID=35708 RepID=A0A0A9FBX9_ARUDO